MRKCSVSILVALATLSLSAQTKGGGSSGSGGTRVEGPLVNPSTAAPISGMGGGWGREYNNRFSSTHTTTPNPGRTLRTVRANLGGPGVIGTWTRVIVPPHRDRVWTCPTPEFWRKRDILTEMQIWARRGCIPVIPVDDLASLEDFTYMPAGWKAYGMLVPPKETVTFKLDHSNRGWFRVTLCNKWGTVEQGMLHSLLHQADPKIAYTNPFDEPRFVYVVVDDPGWMSTKGNPFSLAIQRSWDPGKYAKQGLPMAAGIWAVHKPEKPMPKLAVALWR